MNIILGHGFFFLPLISFTVCSFIALYQARRIASRRFPAFVMHLCALAMCAYSAYATPLQPDWLLMVFLAVLVIQSALICTTPVRTFPGQSNIPA